MPSRAFPPHPAGSRKDPPDLGKRNAAASGGTVRDPPGGSSSPPSDTTLTRANALVSVVLGWWPSGPKRPLVRDLSSPRRWFGVAPHRRGRMANPARVLDRRKPGARCVHARAPDGAQTLVLAAVIPMRSFVRTRCSGGLTPSARRRAITTADRTGSTGLGKGHPTRSCRPLSS